MNINNLAIVLVPTLGFSKLLFEIFLNYNKNLFENIKIIR